MTNPPCMPPILAAPEPVSPAAIALTEVAKVRLVANWRVDRTRAEVYMVGDIWVIVECLTVIFCILKANTEYYQAWMQQQHVERPVSTGQPAMTKRLEGQVRPLCPEAFAPSLPIDGGDLQRSCR